MLESKKEEIRKMNKELMGALDELEREKNISKETLLDAIEQSLIQACKNHFGKADNVHVTINPETGEFFVTDAKDYVTPGTLYCFSRDGKKKWSVITGDIPAHIAFTDKKLKAIQ